MNAPQPNYTEIGAVVFTAGFQIQGTLHVLGILQTFVNDDQKPTLIVYGAEALGLEPTNPAARLTQQELIVNKRSIQIIGFPTPPPQGSLTLLARGEPLVMYTDNFAVAAKYHMGPDSRVADFAEASLQQFIVASEAKIYPLFPTRPGFFSASSVVLIHKNAIRMYHSG
jgi:hypothetical protein